MLFPRRNRAPAQQRVVDLSTPRGRLQWALAQFTAHLQDNPETVQGVGGLMMPGVLHFLQQICTSITDQQVLDTVAQVRRQLDYIAGDIGAPSLAAEQSDL